MRRASIRSWSSGIVVASTSMPATFVFVGFAARPIGAAAPVTPSRSASRVVRTRDRRTRRLITLDLHGIGWGGGRGPAWRGRRLWARDAGTRGVLGALQWNPSCQARAMLTAVPGGAPPHRRIERALLASTIG